MNGEVKVRDRHNNAGHVLMIVKPHALPWPWEKEGRHREMKGGVMNVRDHHHSTCHM